MNKKTKRNLIYGGIVLLLIAIAIVPKFYAIWTGALITCSFSDATTISCTGDAGITDFSGNATLTIDSPYNLYNKQFDKFMEVLKSQSVVASQFFTANTQVCGGNPDQYRVIASDDNLALYQTVFPGLAFRDNDYTYCLSRHYDLSKYGAIRSTFPNQLVLVQGTISNAQNTKSFPFKTWGLCDLLGDGANGAKCIVYSPESVISQLGSEQAYATMSSITIKPKVGGYSQGDECIIDSSLCSCPAGQVKCSDGICKASCNVAECVKNEDCTATCEGTNTCSDYKCVCVPPINPPGILAYVLIILAIALIGGLVYVFFKTKKKR